MYVCMYVCMHTGTHKRKTDLAETLCSTTAFDHTGITFHGQKQVRFQLRVGLVVHALDQ